MNNWIRLQRVGSVVNGYYGPDGVNWNLSGSQDTATWNSAAPGWPTGALIGTNGVITWTPNGTQLGSYTFQVQVNDARGGTATQSYPLSVVTTQSNQPPIITSTPVVSATANDVYAYNLTGSDPENDPLSWSLTTAWQ